MRRPSNGADWPLVGRSEELALLRRLRAGAPATSAVISGAPGVGKTRLARQAAAEAARQGWATCEIRGSAGFAAVPLGPFRTAFELPPAADPTELAEGVTRRLADLRRPGGLLLLIDDSHALDELSAGLLHQVVATGLAVAVITTRAGATVQPALTDLWKDGFAERIELQNLSRLETADLLAAGLGGAVQDSTANRIWHMTSGNPLYLREVALSGTESGALSEVHGEWCWHGEWASGTRLAEVVAGRLGRLDPDELTAMEVLALAGSLPLGLLTALTSSTAVQELERRDLVATERSDRRIEVTMAQPLHAEILRRGMPALQQRSVWRNLVNALSATGARRASDRVRLACWSIESGLEVDPATLALGSDASLFGFGRALAGRLGEIMPEAPGEPRADGPSVSMDHDRAVRLARAAYGQSGDLGDGVALASTLAWTGAADDAEAVLSGLQGAAAVDDRIRVALGLAWVRFWGRYRVDEARSVLGDVLDDPEAAAADPLLVAAVHQELAGIALNTAQPAAALRHAGQAAAVQGVELSRSVAAPVASAALAYLGQVGEAVALIDGALPAVEPDHPLAMAQLLFARAAALSSLGALEESRQLAEWLREVALSGELLHATAVFGVLLGDIHMRQGRPRSASRILRDSVGLFAESDTFGYRPWALAGLARARALLGEEDAAVAALEEARGTQGLSRHYDTAVHLAQIEVHRLAGRVPAAAEAAGDAAAWARAAGMVTEEARVLEVWFRLAPSPEIADRLAALAAGTDSLLVHAAADYARASLSSDADALLAVSDRYGAMAAWALAAEAASEAARILDRRHQDRAAAAAARVAAGLADRCEGVRPAAADLTAASSRLTRREREIGALAAAGRSTRAIAEQMFLSPRTVENHLYRAYVKLGVSDRAGLAAALAPDAPAE